MGISALVVAWLCIICGAWTAVPRAVDISWTVGIFFGLLGLLFTRWPFEGSVDGR
jgi:hypothetical protein